MSVDIVPAAPRRPCVKPGLRRLHRSRDTVQFGLDPDCAVVVTGLDPAAWALLDRLDGTIEICDLPDLARSLGISPARAMHLIARLVDAGVLTDAATRRPGWSALPAATRERLAPDLAAQALLGTDRGEVVSARRFAARVRVVGAGRVGAAVAGLLGAAGVGMVEVEDPGLTRPGDLSPAGLRGQALGLARDRAARPDPLPAPVRAAARAALGRDPRPVPVPLDVIVLTRDDGRPGEPGPGTEHVARLYVELNATTATVGPFVLAGISSCRRCHDLARADRDPSWPSVAAQLADPDPPDRVGACDTVLATVVAGHATLQVLRHLDGTRPSTVDGTLTISLPEGDVRRRSWRAHPLCGCSWASAGPVAPGTPRAGWVTMAR